MNDEEEMIAIKQDDLDVCPECGNRKGNTIHLSSEQPGEPASIDCAKCGNSWQPDVQNPDE